MAKRLVVFHPEARAELFEASDYYLECNPQLASRFEHAVENLVKRIAENPEQFAFDKPPVQLALVSRFPYYLPFVEDKDAVRVLGVCHASRRPGYWEDRLNLEDGN